MNANINEMIREHGTDYVAGYEVAVKFGQEIICGRRVNRTAPEHLSGKRYVDWKDGYIAGLSSRKLSKIWVVSCRDIDGKDVEVSRTGSVKSIVQSLLKIGFKPNRDSDFVFRKGNTVRTVGI